MVVTEEKALPLPDEEMPVAKETAKLLEVVEGAENVERMDALLSLAVTGGDYEWI